VKSFSLGKRRRLIEEEDLISLLLDREREVWICPLTSSRKGLGGLVSFLPTVGNQKTVLLLREVDGVRQQPLGIEGGSPLVRPGRNFLSLPSAT